METIIGVDDGYRLKTTTTGDITIVGDFQVHGMSTIVFSPSEKAIIDILPKIKDTHPDLYLKYIDMIPEKN